jgi:3-deoxy-D-arabino-heptulosonate 7-phosphate (DAHP) synthase class II
MFRIIAFAILLGLLLGQTSLALAQTIPAPSPMLDDYKWKNRLLLVFAPAADHPAYKQQKELISKETQGLQDRHLLVLDVIGGGEAKKLLEQFKVKATEFTILLVGKDGTEKYRSRQPVALQDIFDVIDQMPMRQQEMRGQE